MILGALMFFAVFTSMGVSIALSARRIRGWLKLFPIGAGLFVFIGALGVFGNALSGEGGLNWLPATFEWPVGRADGVVTTADGWHVVPVGLASRLQVYDPDWRFVRGWPVDAGGKAFKITSADANRVEVLTSKGRMRFVFDREGRVLSRGTYDDDEWLSSAPIGCKMFVPTRPWLWTISSPGLSFAIMMFGGVVWKIVDKLSGGDRLKGPTRGPMGSSS